MWSAEHLRGYLGFESDVRGHDGYQEQFEDDD